MTIRMKMLFALAVLSSLALKALAQEPPPNQNFVFLGEIYREKNSPPACCDAADLVLPRGFKLDHSYHQTAINCCGGGASSQITPADIPAGIYMTVKGGFYWALPKAPVLIPDVVDYDDDHVVQWRFRTPLYCGPGGNGEGCNIRVRVWAKELKKPKNNVDTKKVTAKKGA